ncbi:ParB N-terminal domain-containing protein [Henriciella aquimarina]|uniref:ParB N-terminal domain-containing protein n=1 Tax=Henriciella aquimarina TaxID=545261 RepID=UPI0009FDC72C|nr:ParB N-terminal domain-containing protein [Henriciella aquimarina]
MLMPIDDIRVGERYRRELGDLQPLADSIAKQGLLQPVGVTEDGLLVFGERRLTACRDILGLAEIEARIVNVTSIIEGEHDENEVRKDFTISERVAIGEAVERMLGERQGQRTDQLRVNCAEVPQGRNRDLAAKGSGFGSGTTYERAKSVIESAVPELIGKMDDEEISISAAATIAAQPKEVQAEVIQLDRKARNKAVSRIKKGEGYSLDDPELARKMQQHIIEKVQDINGGLRQADEAGMTGEEFLRDALPYTIQQVRERAPRLMAFLQAIQEVNHDQSATG